MLARLLVVGVTWLVAVILFAALLQWSGSRPAGVDPGRDGVTALARSLNQLRPAPAGAHAWTVTRATSALRALVVDVDAVNPDQARQIAERLVTEVGAQYDEVIIYVHALDPARDARTRRIGWTPRRGYLASDF